MGTLVDENTLSQCGMILTYMREHGAITQAEAAEKLGCWRLGARIWDLKSRGHNIRREMVTERNRFGNPVRYARYSLIEEAGA